MKLNRSKPIQGIMALAVVLSTAACQLPARITRQTDPDRIPDRFSTANADTATIADRTAKIFFDDTALQRLIDSAVAYNYRLRIADLEAQMGSVFFDMQSRLRRPTLEAGLNGQLDRYGFYTMNGLGNYDLNKSGNITPDQRIPDPVPEVFLGLRSRWEIDLWGRLKQMREAARHQWLARQEGRHWMQTQLVAEVAGAYYELRALRFEQEVIDRNIALQQQALGIVSVLKEGGRATELAVQQFQAQVYRTTTLRFDMARRIIELENHLNFLCGRYPQPISVSASMMQQPLPQWLQTGMPMQLLDRRPDIREARQLLQVAYTEVDIARATMLPALTIGAYGGWQGFKLPAFFNAESLAAGIAGQLTAPLLQRRQLRLQHAMASITASQQWLQLQERVRLAVSEVETALQSGDQLDKQFRMQQRELDVWRQAVSTANALYRNGYANYLEVITAQQSLLDAELELVRVRNLQWQNVIQLYRASGGGWR